MANLKSTGHEMGYRSALQAMGYKSEDITDNHLEQLEVFMEAFELFMVRDQHHKSLWKEYGASDTAHHCKSKAMRLNVEPAEHLDDAYDLINYAAFTVRNVKEGRL